MKRGPKEGLPRSPWAIKRLNQFGKKMKSQIMERMKTEIEILRNFKHPNIIAFRLVQKLYLNDYTVYNIGSMIKSISYGPHRMDFMHNTTK